MLIRNRQFMVFEGETGSLTGGQQSQQQQENQQQQQASQENFNENNVDDFNDLWQTENSENKGNENNNQQQQQSQQQNSSDELLQNHIESLNLGGGINQEQLRSDLAEGKIDALTAAIQQVAANAYKAAMIDANKMFDQKLTGAEERIVNKTSANYQGNDLVKKMHETLPVTKQGAYEPVAKMVLGQMLRKGLTGDKAIEGVRNYFANLSKGIGTDLELNFNSKDEQSGGDTDFVNLLTGK